MMTNVSQQSQTDACGQAYRRAYVVVSSSLLYVGEAERDAKFAAHAFWRWALVAKRVESVKFEHILEVSYFLFEARLLWSQQFVKSPSYPRASIVFYFPVEFLTKQSPYSHPFIWPVQSPMRIAYHCPTKFYSYRLFSYRSSD